MAKKERKCHFTPVTYRLFFSSTPFLKKIGSKEEKIQEFSIWRRDAFCDWPRGALTQSPMTEQVDTDYRQNAFILTLNWPLINVQYVSNRRRSSASYWRQWRVNTESSPLWLTAHGHWTFLSSSLTCKLEFINPTVRLILALNSTSILNINFDRDFEVFCVVWICTLLLTYAILHNNVYRQEMSTESAVCNRNT